MTQWLLVRIPTWVLGVVIAGVVVGLSVAGLVMVRRNVALQTLESHNAVAGFIIAVVGVVYAVLLGFVVVVVWQQFISAQAAADQEAADVASLFECANAFAEPQRSALDGRLRSYAASVVNHEWPAMARGAESVRTEHAFHGLWSEWRAVKPGSKIENRFYIEAVQVMGQLTQARNNRLLASHAKLPAVMWAALITGGVITIGFTYFFGVPNFKAQLLMVAVLAAMIAVVLFLILAMNYPFTGGLSIPPRSMQDVLEDLRFIRV
jgi:hypothetical protein